MRINEILQEDYRKVTYEFHREPENWFVATADGKEIGRFQGKSQFDSSAAQDAAKKCITLHRSNAAEQHNKDAENRYQYEKPLSDIEKRWLLLYKKLYIDNQHGDDEDYRKFRDWAMIVRQSISQSQRPQDHTLAKEFLGSMK